MYLLGQVVAKGLMQMGRMTKIFIQLPDRPGALKQIVDKISELGINIVEVIHDRLSADISPGTAGVYLSLEMENKYHGKSLMLYLMERGLKFRLLS
jgi:threonine dehydratase